MSPSGSNPARRSFPNGICNIQNGHALASFSLAVNRRTKQGEIVCNDMDMLDKRGDFDGNGSRPMSSGAPRSSSGAGDFAEGELEEEIPF